MEKVALQILYIIFFLLIFNIQHNEILGRGPLAYILNCQQLRLPTTFCQQLCLPTFPIANRAIATSNSCAH